MKSKFFYGALGSLVVLIGISSFVNTSFAKTSDLEVAGWIPYWRDSQGIDDAEDNLRYIDTVFPFAYSVTSAGALKDLAGLDEKEWTRFKKTAEKKDVEVIPTVMWSDGARIHQILSNPLTRLLHVLFIALMVAEGDFDGVDIDYEGKKSETYEYFGLFLKDLKGVLGDKVLSCSIEARTPPESLYREVPETINYANDLKAIAKYCDRVQIMAYDQQRADIKLNSERKGLPYAPIADVDWVEKVVEFMLEDIPKEKMVLGLATYGHHYSITVAPEWFRDYRKVGALNIPDILDMADEYDVEPTRNSAGEMSFSYVPKSYGFEFPKNIRISRSTPEGDIVAKKALEYANETGKEMVFNVLSYSDAGAMKEKIDLAEKYNLKGVALFKIDGEEDSKVWRYLR